MDPIQLMQLLGAPIPRGAPQAPMQGIGPGGNSPPVVTPPFLPGNLSNVMTLGQRPVPGAPAPIPMPSMLNIPDLMKQYAGAFEIPKAPVLPEATQRGPLTFADPSKMVASMQALAPKDPQMDKAQFEQKRFADALAAAALASTQADGLGSVLAAAGGAFGQAASGANEERRAEALAFEERNKAFEAQMAQLQWDVDQSKAEQANATSDLDFQNAQAREARAAEQLGLTMQQQESERSALAQKLGINLDMLQFNTEQETTRASITAQNQDRQRAYEQKYEPQWEISADGSTLTQTYLDPQTNKMVVHQEPVGVMGQMQQMSQMASLLPNGLGGELQANAIYDNMARIAPQMLKRQLIMDVLDTPKGEKVFEPDDAGTSGMNAGTSDSFAEYFNVGKTLTDQFTTSDYEAVLNKAEKFISQQVEANRLTPEQAVTEYKVHVARLLEPMLTPEVMARIKKLQNPNLTYGLGLIK